MQGAPDFFVDGGIDPADANLGWLDADRARVRDRKYDLCVDEMPGMAWCIERIAERSGAGTRLLEVGAGTGHFTRWLAEACAPGTEIYAFDFSWPMLRLVRQKAPDAYVFRANARAALPFHPNAFDVVLARLAPLGTSPAVKTAFELLADGGLYVQAGWTTPRFDPAPAEWAMRHGYVRAEFHVWRYTRVESEEEHLCGILDGVTAPYVVVDEPKAREHVERLRGEFAGVRVETEEHALLACKA